MITTALEHGARRPRPCGALALGLALVLVLPLPGRGQGPQAAEPELAADSPEFATGTAQVLLDVVIRDKRGRAITDIRPEEVEVFEEGERQEVEGFRRIESAPPEVEAGAAAPDTARQLNLVTIVFDKLSPNGRKLAQSAAQAFLDEAVNANTWVSIFMVDTGLGMVHPFSNHRGRLKAAVAEATSGTYQGIQDEQAALAQAEIEAQQTAAAAPGEGSGAGAPAEGGSYAAAAQAQALANMLRLASQLQRQQSGQTSLYPLLALIRGQQDLAGRKTILYVSEGLDVPPQLEQVFRSTISTANRANVSVYAIDARGLDTSSQSQSARDALDRARDLGQAATASRGGGSVSKAEIQMAETAESALRLNTQGTLEDLSTSTGGFLIANTNRFDKGAEQLAADLGGYYELTYTPPPAPFDGRFREIEVKVSRRDAQVQTRSGYFALPPGQASAMFAYEVPLLAALEQETPPSDFALRAAAMQFEPQPQGREHRLVIEAPIGELELRTDEVAGTYDLHFSLLAVIRDAQGNVAERFSEDYPFQGPIDRAEGLKMGNIVLKREFDLPPGSYTLEVAGQDRLAGKASVLHTGFRVEAAGAGPAMSSLALIRRVDPLPEGSPASGDPLEIGPMRIVPNLGMPISAATNDKLSLFFIAYPPSGGGQPTMTLEFARDGKPVGKAQPALPAPDPDGRIRYVGTFPLSSFPPGSYEVKVGLEANGAGCSQSTGFTIVP